MHKTYDYKNVYLVPKPSDIKTSDEVDLSVQLSDELKLSIPIIGSPMKGIISPELVTGLANWGGIGIFHRFYDGFPSLEEDIARSLIGIDGDNNNFGVAFGLGDNRYKTFLDYGVSIICVDVANGYLDSVKEFCLEIANYIHTYNYDCLLMSGNVSTYDGVHGLAQYGVDLIRVGIGTGNLCTTRKVTGIGYGQITALQNCRKYVNVKLIADGGIHSSGDVVKALAAGADAVMIGSLFGQTYESASNGTIYGMASRKLQEEYYDMTRSIEGIEKVIEKTSSLDDFLYEFLYGVRHGFTYVGARNIKELREKAEFVEVV